MLYAPTWRDTVATSPWTAKLFDGLDLEALAQQLGDRYAVLLRGHNYNLREGLSPIAGHVWDVSAYPEINDLMLAADVAVLDYSSIRFDWLDHGQAGGVLRARPGGLSELAHGFVRLRADGTWSAAGYHAHEVAEALLDLGTVVCRVRCRPGIIQQGVQQASRRASDGTGHQCVFLAQRRPGASLMSSSTVSSSCWPSSVSLWPSPARHGHHCGCWVSVLGMAGQLVQTALRADRGVEPAGSVVGAAGDCRRRDGGMPGDLGPRMCSRPLGAALGAAILVGSIVVEPFVARATRFRVPIAVRLPNLPTRRSLRDLGPLAVAASAVATIAGLLLAALGASSWWWAVISLLAVAPVAVLAVDGRSKIVLARRLRRLVPRAVAAYAPDFVVYTSRPDDASYQMMMWLPYLQRAGLRFIIIARNAVPAAALAELTDVPVVEARGIADLDALVVPSLKAAFYVNASSGNGALVRFQHLTHIYLGHGDSDKPPSYNPTHAMYDQIFAAGPAATRRYAAHGVRIPSEKFTIVGRPQVENVKQSTTRIADVPEPTVLYAPTWRGHVEETMLYSLPLGERIVSALLARGATVIFRPHPFSYDFPDDAATIARINSLLEADRRKTGRPHLWGAAAEKDRSILDCINDSDAMVSDVSSVVSDYLFSGKPFAMIAVPAEPEAFVVEYPVARASYVIRADLADLDAQLEKMLGDDPLAGQRADIRADYLGDFPADNYAAAFVDAVHNVSRKPMEDMEDDQAEDPGAEQAVANEDDRSAEDAGRRCGCAPWA